jgi:hypothetical protein
MYVLPRRKFFKYIDQDCPFLIHLSNPLNSPTGALWPMSLPR